MKVALKNNKLENPNFNFVLRLSFLYWPWSHETFGENVSKELKNEACSLNMVHRVWKLLKLAVMFFFFLIFY